MGYLNNWFKVIDHIKDDQLFKAAWARGIIECIEKEEYQVNNKIARINEYDIVKKLIKYHWNLLSYYGLKSHAYKKVLNHIQDLEKMYYENKYIYRHVWYNEIDAFFNYYPQIQEQEIKKFMTLAHKGYDYKFLMIKKEHLPLYEIDTTMKQLVFTVNQVKVIREYKKELLNLIHYKWAEVLEKHYTTPLLIDKIVQSNKDKLVNNQYKKEMKFLIENYHIHGIKDFFTQENLSVEDSKVIPILPTWYLGQQSIWNLVIVSKDYKMKHQVDEKMINLLKTRNSDLLNHLENNHSSFKKELLYAYEEKVLDRMYLDYCANKK